MNIVPYFNFPMGLNSWIKPCLAWIYDIDSFSEKYFIFGQTYFKVYCQTCIVCSQCI